MRVIIGVVLIVIGGVLTAVTEFVPFIALLFVGVFLFASSTSENTFVDYIIANTTVALVRKRKYIDFLPFSIISSVLTLGKSVLKIVYKEEYYKVDIAFFAEKPEFIALPRKEFILLRNEQRKIYSTEALSREFMENAYSLESIALKRKKNRLIAASVFAILSNAMLFEPDGGIYIGSIYVAVFVPMVLLWIPEYKDAKILHQAFERSTKSKN